MYLGWMVKSVSIDKTVGRLGIVPWFLFSQRKHIDHTLSFASIFRRDRSLILLGASRFRNLHYRIYVHVV